MRKSAITINTLCTLALLSILVLGCSGSVRVGEKPGPVQRAEPDPVKYARMENGILLPEIADYPEISIEVAIQLFRDCKVAAGFGNTIESEIGTLKACSETWLGPTEYSNTLRVNDSEFLIIVRTRDAKVVTMTNLTATPDSVAAELTEPQARCAAKLMFQRFNVAEEKARQLSPQLPERDQPDYELSFLDRDAPGMYSNAWYVQWDRVSPISYYQQNCFLRLRPDGLFLNGATREGERCYETEAVLDETQALDIAGPVFTEQYEWLHSPTFAYLAYVIPNKYPTDRVGPSSEFLVPVLPMQNRLAWVVGIEAPGHSHFPSGPEVWVDAITGEVIGGLDPYERLIN